jgi:hypothetical protein
MHTNKAVTFRPSVCKFHHGNYLTVLVLGSVLRTVWKTLISALVTIGAEKHSLCSKLRIFSKNDSQYGTLVGVGDKM